jgi:hypothetical protein
MTNTNSTVTNNVITMVEEFRKATVINRSELDQITLNGRRKVWENVAQAALLAHEINKPENKADYHAALKAHGLEVPAEGKKVNAYTLIVKLLYGEWSADQTNVFQPNRSAEKYACVFRYLAKRRDRLDTVESIVAHIEGVEGNLKAIEAQDRAEHKKPGTTPQASANDNFDLGLRLDLGEVAKLDQRPEFIPEEVSYGKLWFRMVDGKVAIMGYEKVEEPTFKTLATKRGKAIRDAHNAKLA